MQNQNITKSLQSYVNELPEKFKNSGFNNFTEKSELLRLAKLSCMKFCSYESEKLGLFLCGPVGVGKTHLAIATLRNLKSIPGEKYQRRAIARIINADEFFMMLNDAVIEKKSKLEIIKGLLQNNDVLCLDDLGTKNFTDAKQENLYVLINHAYMNMRKIIITTNFSLDDLAKYDERISSRLYEMCHIIILRGEDHRIIKKDK